MYVYIKLYICVCTFLRKTLYITLYNYHVLSHQITVLLFGDYAAPDCGNFLRGALSMSRSVSGLDERIWSSHGIEMDMGQNWEQRITQIDGWWMVSNKQTNSLVN